jgi:hypothetical protein
VDGSGTAAYVTFRVKRYGTSKLDLYDTVLIVYHPNEGSSERVSHTVSDGYFLNTWPGGCPVLKVWNGKEFEEIEKLNIHSEEGVDTRYSTRFKMKPFDGKTYGLILEEKWYALLEGSHIDSVKLTDSGGRECKLIKAEHSKIGDVLGKLRESDDLRIETKPGESIELNFIGCSGDEFTLTIEGYNWFPRFVKMALSQYTLMVIVMSIIVLIAVFAVFRVFMKRYSRGA